MRKFIVAHANLFDNELHIEIIEEATEALAIYNSKVMEKWVDIDKATWLEEYKNEELEELKEYFFDVDIILNVLELT